MRTSPIPRRAVPPVCVWPPASASCPPRWTSDCVPVAAAETLISGSWAERFRPLGALARADYERLAELEPKDPWHTLVLAWLAGVQGEAALQRTLAVAQSIPDAESARVQIFAWQQLAWLRRDQGRVDEAQQAATQAMGMAEEILRRSGDDLARPAAELALRDAAQTGSTFALALEDAGQKPPPSKSF